MPLTPGTKLGVYEILGPLPDGRRFVFIQAPEEEQESPQPVVIPNWFDELNRLVPVNH